MGHLIYISNRIILTPIKYGLLYNWYAATDARYICASGWHLPSQTEWVTLTTYCGGTSVAGAKLRTVGTEFWKSPNDLSTNEYGLSLRGGYFRIYGDFNTNEVYTLPAPTCWFMDSFDGAVLGPSYATACGYVYTQNNSSSLNISVISDGKQFGQYVRLIKDSTTLSNGQSGTYIGNDGKVYRTKCIGTQEWLVYNLAETKYRNGDWVHGFESGTYTPITNANWAALKTEGVCCYNDDTSNI